MLWPIARSVLIFASCWDCYRYCSVFQLSTMLKETQLFKSTYSAFTVGWRKDKYCDKMDRYYVDFKDQSSHKRSETETETHQQQGQAWVGLSRSDKP